MDQRAGAEEFANKEWIGLKHIMTLKVAWLGDLGFPFGLANIQKVILVCKGLRQCGVNTIVVNRFGHHSSDSGLDIKREGIYEDIKYIYASGDAYRPRNVFVRNSCKLYGLLREIYLLSKFKKRGKLDAAILHTDKFLSILFYRIISKYVGFPIVMLYVELYSSVDDRQNLRHRINGYLYEKYGFYLLDGIMPISDYLIDFVKSRNPRLPIMKVPMLTDFDRFNGVENNKEEKYFLFCGAAGYSEIIIFILKAFELVESSEDVWLYLVVNGTPGKMRIVKEKIANNKKTGLIKVHSKITDSQLTELYANACGLLIPLRPNITDKARFPHKIGEYLASGNPIVTTNYGEIIRYFEDGKSALIAGSYDIAEFAEKMKYIISHPEKAEEIGREGREVGLENFSYKQYGTRINDFIGNIIKNK